MYHGEQFVEMPHKRHVGGQLRFYYDFKKDYMSFFEIERIVKNFSYIKEDEIFYLLLHRPIQIGIRSIKDDKDCMEMLTYHEGKKFVDVYMYNLLNQWDAVR